MEGPVKANGLLADGSVQLPLEPLYLSWKAAVVCGNRLICRQCSFLSGRFLPPEVGEELPVQLRMTTAYFNKQVVPGKWKKE